jgi:hypothetical protein
VRTRSIFAVFALVAPLFVGASARAQETLPFSERAKNVIALDNLGGFAHTSSSVEGSQATGTNNIGLFPLAPLVSRFGYHRFLEGGLSIGGSLIYSHESLNLGGLTPGGTTTFGIAPRIGYAIPAGTSTAFWLRAGFAYLHGSSDNSDSGFWQLAPGAEAYVVLTPFSHFGITIGPFVEYGAVGKQSSCTTAFINPGGGQSVCTARDLHMFFVGLGVGVLADF